MNIVADMLSRNPLETELAENLPLRIRVRVVKVGPNIIPTESLREMVEAAMRDEDYVELVDILDRAIPLREVDNESPHCQLKQHWDQLSTQEVVPGQKLVVWNQWILVPNAMRQDLISKFHKAHLGVKLIADTLEVRYFWPQL